jgi:hypothetical protein
MSDETVAYRAAIERAYRAVPSDFGRDVEHTINRAESQIRLVREELERGGRLSGSEWMANQARWASSALERVANDLAGLKSETCRRHDAFAGYLPGDYGTCGVCGAPVDPDEACCARSAGEDAP